MRRRAKTDRNQSAIVDELRQMGFSVYPLHRVGQGFPDLAVGRAGRTVLVEIKRGKGSLTDDERAFFAEWQGAAMVARSAEDVLRYFEAA